MHSVQWVNNPLGRRDSNPWHHRTTRTGKNWDWTGDDDDGTHDDDGDAVDDGAHDDGGGDDDGTHDDDDGTYDVGGDADDGTHDDDGSYPAKNPPSIFLPRENLL